MATTAGQTVADGAVVSLVCGNANPTPYSEWPDPAAQAVTQKLVPGAPGRGGLTFGTTAAANETLTDNATITATTTANVVSSAGDATLSVSQPGHLMNGSFALPEPLRVGMAPASWSAPVSNAAVAITFTQAVKATDALRTGSYAKTLTFTLSTTSP